MRILRSSTPRRDPLNLQRGIALAVHTAEKQVASASAFASVANLAGAKVGVVALGHVRFLVF